MSLKKQKKRCLSFRNLYYKQEIGHLTTPTLSLFHKLIFPPSLTHFGTLEISFFSSVPSKRGGRESESGWREKKSYEIFAPMKRVCAQGAQLVYRAVSSDTRLLGELRFNILITS